MKGYEGILRMGGDERIPGEGALDKILLKVDKQLSNLCKMFWPSELYWWVFTNSERSVGIVYHSFLLTFNLSISGEVMNQSLTECFRMILVAWCGNVSMGVGINGIE